MNYRVLTIEETAQETGLPVSVIQLYAELGIIVPATGYTTQDVCELRRVRRLMEDLALQHEAIEVLLRMRQRIVQLEDEVQRLQAERRQATMRRSISEWLDAEWLELR